MSPPNFQKVFSLFLTITFFTSQVALGSTGESNLWAERRRQFSARENSQDAPQFASLPTTALGNNLANPKDLLRQFPGLNRALEFVTAVSPSPSKSKLPSSVAPYVEAIPLNLGTVKEIHLNKKRATPNSPLVVLIQDVHLNQEAQQNIANILLSLNDTAFLRSPAHPMLVGVEGAFGPFDFSRFRAFEDKRLVKAVADYFLKENKFAAPSYVGITAENPSATFFGIDDREHYKANVEAYRSSQHLKKSLTSSLEKAKRSLTDQKHASLNPELKKFDAKRSVYLDGSTGFGEFTAYLSRTSDDLGLNTDDQNFMLEQFLAAYDMEKSLDFQKVERERARIVEKLAAKLTKDEINQLVAQSLAYRMGKVTFAGYYKSIKALIDSHGIALTEAPSFDRYIRYVLLADGIEAESLMKSIQRLETQVLNELCRTREEKDLMQRSKDLYLVGKLLDFGLTPDEWKEYGERADKIKDIFPELTSLNAFEDFYEEADIRTERIVDNLLGQVTSQSPVATLIVGGFHTPHLTSLLKEKGQSFAVVQPKITKVDDQSGTEYLSVFTREKTPLDELFEGEKLFLGPDYLAVGNPSAISAQPNADLMLTTEGISTALVRRNLPEGLFARIEGDAVVVQGSWMAPRTATTNLNHPQAVGPVFEFDSVPPFRYMRTSLLKKTWTSLKEFLPSLWKKNFVEKRHGEGTPEEALRERTTGRAWMEIGMRAGVIIGLLMGVSPLVMAGVPQFSFESSVINHLSRLAFVATVLLVPTLLGILLGNAGAHTYYLVQAEHYGWAPLTLPRSVAEKREILKSLLEVRMQERRYAYLATLAVATFDDALTRFLSPGDEWKNKDILLTDSFDVQKLKKLANDAKIELALFRMRGTNQWVMRKGNDRDIDFHFKTGDWIFDISIHNHPQDINTVPSANDLINEFYDVGTSAWILGTDGAIFYDTNNTKHSENPEQNLELHHQVFERYIPQSALKIDPTTGGHTQDTYQLMREVYKSLNIIVSPTIPWEELRIEDLPRNTRSLEEALFSESYKERHMALGALLGLLTPTEIIPVLGSFSQDPIKKNQSSVVSILQKNFDPDSQDTVEVTRTFLKSKFPEIQRRALGVLLGAGIYDEKIGALIETSIRSEGIWIFFRSLESVTPKTSAVLINNLGEKIKPWTEDSPPTKDSLSPAAVDVLLELGQDQLIISLIEDQIPAGSLHVLTRTEKGAQFLAKSLENRDVPPLERLKLAEKIFSNQSIPRNTRNDLVDTVIQRIPFSCFHDTFFNIDAGDTGGYLTNFFMNFFTGEFFSRLEGHSPLDAQRARVMRETYQSRVYYDISVNRRTYLRKIAEGIGPAGMPSEQKASRTGQWSYTTVVGLVMASAIAWWMLGDHESAYRLLATVISVVAGLLAVLSASLAWVLPHGFIASTRAGQITWNTGAMLALRPFAKRFVVAEEFWHSQTTSKLQGVMDFPVIGLLVRALDEFLAKSFGIVVTILLSSRFTQRAGFSLLIATLPVRRIGDSKAPALPARLQRVYGRESLRQNTQASDQLRDKTQLVNALIGITPITRLGLDGQIVDANDLGQLEVRDIFALSLLADGRKPSIVDVETGERISGPVIETDATLVTLDPSDPDFSRKAALVRSMAAANEPIIVYAQGITERQAQLLGNVALVDSLTGDAIKAVESNRKWVIKTLDVRFLSKNSRALNREVVASLDVLQADGYTVTMRMAVLLMNSLVLVPVTRGDLQKMFELEQKVQQLVGSQA